MVMTTSETHTEMIFNNADDDEVFHGFTALDDPTAMAVILVTV